MHAIQLKSLKPGLHLKSSLRKNVLFFFYLRGKGLVSNRMLSCSEGQFYCKDYLIAYDCTPYEKTMRSDYSYRVTLN